MIIEVFFNGNKSVIQNQISVKDFVKNLNAKSRQIQRSLKSEKCQMKSWKVMLTESSGLQFLTSKVVNNYLGVLPGTITGHPCQVSAHG